MEQLLISIFGVQNHLTTFQEMARAGLIFFYGLILLRVCGPRMFGHWSALDIIITILVGSALARAMTGGGSLPGTMAAAAVITALQAVLACLVARHPRLAHLVEGRPVLLIDHGRIDHAARIRNMISEADLHEALRQRGIDGEGHVSNVKAMTLEPSGHLSIVKVEPCKPDHT